MYPRAWILTGYICGDEEEYICDTGHNKVAED